MVTLGTLISLALGLAAVLYLYANNPNRDHREFNASHMDSLDAM